MKINSKQLIELLKKGKAQLIDIRFTEEYLAWRVGPSTSIPLNELPKRLKEIDKNKVIVTTCPHKDRAIIAMVYLRSKGIKAKYLTDGLIGLAENLRGDNAKSFLDALCPKLPALLSESMQVRHPSMQPNTFVLVPLHRLI